MRKSKNPGIAMRVVGALLLVISLAWIIYQFTIPAAQTIAGAVSIIMNALPTVALALVLFALAAVRSRQNDIDDIVNEPTTRLHTHINEVKAAVNDISHQIAMAQPLAPAASTQQPIDGASMKQVIQLLQQIKDLTLMPDDVRRELLGREVEERKRLDILQVASLIEARQFGPAEKLLRQLESEFPADGSLLLARRQLNAARGQIELSTMLRTAERIEELVSIGAHDQAIEMARQLNDNFPGNTEAQDLLERVIKDRDLHHETTGLRMYEEIRHDLDRHMWRRALMHSEKLLEQFPDHPRAEVIREKLATIRENAEIQERQEAEVQIEEHLRNRQFHAAIQIGEQLMQKYPLSPQAEAIEQMLPRIRELADQEPLPQDSAA